MNTRNIPADQNVWPHDGLSVEDDIGGATQNGFFTNFVPLLGFKVFLFSVNLKVLLPCVAAKWGHHGHGA